MRLQSLLVLAAGGVAVGCGLNQEGVPPFADAVFFPGSALVDPTGDWLYVANSNSDLRYNDGTLVALHLRDPQGADQVENLREQGWAACPQIGYVRHHNDTTSDACCWDPLDANILNCDERKLVEPAATVKIGSFAAGMVWQPTCLPAGQTATHRAACVPACEGGHQDGRLFFGVRGNSSVTFVDVKHVDESPGILLDCSSPGAFATCDSDHELTTSTNTIGNTNPDLMNQTPTHLPDEPYALSLDHERQLLYVGHLRGDTAHPGSGGLSLFDVNPALPADVGPNVLPPVPRLVWIQPSIFPADGSGLFGVTSLNQPDPDSTEVFVTSRYLPRVGSVVPTNIPDDCKAQTETPGQIFPALLVAGDAFDTTLPGSEVRGIQFVPGAERAFALQRNPPALIGFDLGFDPAGTMRVSPSEVLETCASPTFLQAHDPGGAGARLYVTCFESGQVYVVDPYVPRLVNVIDVGRGPAGLAFGPGPHDAPGTPDDQTTRAYVVGFSDNNVSVIDLEPESPTQLHVVMRIGFPSTVPR